MKLRAAFLMMFALLLVTSLGCVDESTDGAAKVFSYELWVPITIMAGGLVAAVAGWFLRDALGRFGWALLIGGPIAAIFFGPSMLLDRVVVGEERFSMRSGIWGMTAVHAFDYENVSSVQITKETSGGRRRKTTYYLNVNEKNNESSKVPLNTISEAALPDLLERLKKYNVPVVDRT
jgi:hypothetical protein